MSVSDIAKKLGCTPALVYNVKARVAGKKKQGRPGKGKSAAGLDGLSGILEMVKNSERERAQLRGALEKIQSILTDALA